MMGSIGTRTPQQKETRELEMQKAKQQQMFGFLNIKGRRQDLNSGL